jgi:hypothetical protein
MTLKKRLLAALAVAAAGLLPLFANAQGLPPTAQAEPAAEEYLTKDGKLKERLEIKELQGGFAGYSGTYWTIEPDGSWSRGSMHSLLEEKKGAPTSTGKLTAAQLYALAEVLACHDLATLANHGEAHVNPHILVIHFGKKSAELLPAPGKATPEQDKAIRARYWAITEAVQSVCTKAPVRLLKGVAADGFGKDTTVITTEGEFAKRFGAKALELVKAQVDFSREKVLWVTWSGSSSSYLTYDVKEEAGRMVVMVSVVTPSPAFADLRAHGALLVMPKDAAWQRGGTREFVIPPGIAD